MSASYDRLAGSFYDTTLARVASPAGGYLDAGRFQDYIERYRFNEDLNNGLVLSAGLARRARICCPGSADRFGQPSTEFHAGFVSATYISPTFRSLHNLSFIYNAIGSTAAHHPSPAALAQFAPGLDVGKREYGLLQILSVIYPASPKFYAVVSYAAGQSDFLENYPFPLYYKVWSESGNFVINRNVTFSLSAENLWQSPQGSPLPAPGGIHTVQFTTALKLHLDLNRLHGGT